MNLKSELQNYGVTNVRLFGDSVKPELLDYLDLVEPPESSGLLPDGVAESQGRPLLFFVNESRLTQTQAEQEKITLSSGSSGVSLLAVVTVPILPVSTPANSRSCRCR